MMYFEKPTNFKILHNLIETTWQSQMKVGDSAFIVPDGTSDLIIKANDSSAGIFLCGVMTRPSRIQYDKNIKYFGIRFKPGVLGLFFNLGDINNQLLQVDSLFSNKNQIADFMQNPIENHHRIESLILEQMVKRVDETDLKVSRKKVHEYSQVQYGDVNFFANKMNLSRRQFSANFKKMYGYDPRYFSKIKKFNAFLKCASINHSASLSELAHLSGFYDQSDLCHTIKDISGLTPRDLISQVYNTNIEPDTNLITGGLK